MTYPPGMYCRGRDSNGMHRVKRSIFDADYLYCLECDDTIIALEWPGEPWPGIFIRQYKLVEWP